jgi:hypothetical protein
MALPHPRRPSVSQVLKAPPQRACFCLSKRQSECQCVACGATVQRTARWHGAAASRRSSVSQVLSAKTLEENGLLVRTGSVRASVSVPHAAQPCSALRCGMALPHPRRPSVSQVLKAPPQRTCFCLSKRQSECQCAACGATVQRTALWHDACASMKSKCLSSAQRENSPSKNVLFACRSVRASVSVSHAAQPCSALRGGMALPRPGVQASFKC